MDPVQNRLATVSGGIIDAGNAIRRCVENPDKLDGKGIKVVSAVADTPSSGRILIVAVDYGENSHREVLHDALESVGVEDWFRTVVSSGGGFFRRGLNGQYVVYGKSETLRDRAIPDGLVDQVTALIVAKLQATEQENAGDSLRLPQI